MSHHIYQTKAFIIDSKDVGEANKLLTLFTADLGLIFVSAQSVRVMKSKLRPSIQDLSFSKVALVRGKEYWRLTSAEKLISLHDKRVPTQIRMFMSSILQFIKRLIAGEAKHEELFDILSKLFTFCLEQKKFLSGKDVELMEGEVDELKNQICRDRLETLTLVARFRILESLGYGSDEEVFKKISKSLNWSVELIEEFKEFRSELSAHIEHALQSSHL